MSALRGKRRSEQGFGQSRVLLRIENDLVNIVQMIDKPGPVRDVRSNHHYVGKTSDQILRIGPSPICHWNPDANIGFASSVR